MLNITRVDAVQQNVRYHNLVTVLYLWVMYVRVIIPGDQGAGRKEKSSHSDKPAPGSPRIGKIINVPEKMTENCISLITPFPY